MSEITQETLGLAALAADMTPVRMSDDGRGLLVAEQPDPWCPHTDPGDAARLADLLGMRVSHPRYPGDGVMVEGDDGVPITVFRSDRTRQYCAAVTLMAAKVGLRMKDA